ncbi:MAG: hypothetical protein OXC27_10620 [Caldilineaceae bacterium]|nr:hypothetical protein [Caldilineaceae bacterium]
MNLRAAAAKINLFLRDFLLRRANSSSANALSTSQTRLLDALLRGETLKSHRYLDGNKEFRLHSLNGEDTPVPWQDVRQLEEKGLLLSNQKFPAATLILSNQGRRLAAKAQGKTVPTEPSANPASSSL